MEKNELIQGEQTGFRKYHSTLDNIVRLENFLKTGFEEGKISVVVLYDFEGAYNNMCHKKMTLKMLKFGFPQRISLFIESYLEGRTFYVRVGKEFSSPRLIKRGLPQGANLSTLLFLIFISDL